MLNMPVCPTTINTCFSKSKFIVNHIQAVHLLRSLLNIISLEQKCNELLEVMITRKRHIDNVLRQAANTLSRLLSYQEILDSAQFI